MRFDILQLDELPSTNLFLVDLEELRPMPEGTVVVAKRQTAGIGQSGNSWSSEAGKNLTFSLLLRPTFLPTQSQFQLHKVLSIAVLQTLQELLPDHNDISIKWPNDIYVGNRKICGMLVNNKISGCTYTLAVCGIGLNVNQTAFDPSIPNPTSLKTVAGKDFELFDVLQLLLHNIGVWYNVLKTGDNATIDDTYFSDMLNFGKPSRYLHHGKTITATITGTDKFGRLLLQTDYNEAIICDIKEIKYLF